MTTAAVSSAFCAISWSGPCALALPIAALGAGRNELLLRIAWSDDMIYTYMPRLAVGPQAALQPSLDRRLFWVRTVPVDHGRCGWA